MLADNNGLSREIGKNFLEEEGRYYIASDSAIALAEIRENIEKKTPYDLIFLFDILPGMKGTEVLGKIRAMEKKDGILLSDASIIVMLTTRSEEIALISNFHNDCDYYLKLPVDRLKLAMILETTKNDLELRFARSA